jgi:hypothetical protein
MRVFNELLPIQTRRKTKMKFFSKMFSGSVLALFMGVCLASPLLMLNNGLSPLSTDGEKPEIGVTVAYAYFDVLSANQNITGLYRTNTNDSLPVVAYLLVLNVTNYSNFTADLEMVGAIPQKGPYVNFTEFFNENGSITKNYPILSNYIHPDEMSAISFDTTLESNQSRLIALSGVQPVQSSTAYEALKSGKILLFAQASARNSENRFASAHVSDVKEVQLSIFGNEYLYNDIVAEGQQLTIAAWNGLDVTIKSEP